MYKKHLDSFVKKKGMTVRTKAGILLPVTLLMAALESCMGIINALEICRASERLIGIALSGAVILLKLVQNKKMKAQLA